MKTLKKLIVVMIVLVGQTFADGLLVPANENYPKDFLRNRLTKVDVEINGLVAVTTVYQEFVNEWIESTDAVYSFPLPENAKATEFLYWRNDTTFQAVLKVKEQAVNPGTGEGGIIAEVNQYIGTNGIKIALNGIAAGSIQKTQLKYINLVDYYQGTCTYKFPLNTADFVKHPIDHLEFNFNVNGNNAIIEFGLSDKELTSFVQDSVNAVKASYVKSKVYLNSDFMFWFKTQKSELGVDFYSVANDSADGHFALFVRPPAIADPDSVLPKRMIFVLGNSSSMFGYKLSSSVDAIKRSLDLLSPSDLFNVIVFNYSTQKWKSMPVEATETNISIAKIFLASISAASGSRLDLGLLDALNQITDDSVSNSIVLFTDGRALINPIEIESRNTFKTGIFPIGFGKDLDRARLEMTANLNYGFVTYFDENDNLKEGIFKVINQLSQPVLMDVAFEYGRADLYDILPTKIPTTYAGSYFFTTGRYSNPVSSAFAMAGKSVAGIRSFGFNLEFSANTNENKFVESLWAKGKIDALEQSILIYGETDVQKQEMIDLSLAYNIRCRYTAYIADYENQFTSIVDRSGIETVKPESYILGNYPNPFNPTTTISFYLSSIAGLEKTKLIKIFNSLGQLVAVIDISHLAHGSHQIVFNGQDFFGNTLPSGLYFARLVAGNEISTIRMSLIK
jgi:Ca-activated chloride channel homolog